MSPHAYIVIIYLSLILGASPLLFVTRDFLLFAALFGSGNLIGIWDLVVWHHGEKDETPCKETELS